MTIRSDNELDNYIVAIDVGAFHNLGWADSENNLIGTFQEVIQNINDRLSKVKVALGFESPIFLPLYNFNNFTSQRSFDNGQPWSAGPGATVCAISPPLITLCLQEIFKKHKDIKVTTDYCTWNKTNEKSLLIWEAFITKNDRELYNIDGNIHMLDAQNAVNSFLNQAQQEDTSCPTLNLPMLLAAHAGFNINLKKLDKTALIVKSDKWINLTWE